MFRRGWDQTCVIAGAVMLLIGTFTYIFPEVSYKSRADDLPQAYTIKKIIIPGGVSASLIIAGSVLIYRSLKIRKRGSSDESGKKMVF